MKQEQRIVCFDKTLGIKAYRFIGVMQEFTTIVAYQSEQVFPLKELHQMLMEEQESFQKEEAFYFLIEQLLENYTDKQPCRFFTH